MHELLNRILMFFGHRFYNPREDPIVQRVDRLERRVDRLDHLQFRPSDLFIREP